MPRWLQVGRGGPWVADASDTPRRSSPHEEDEDHDEDHDEDPDEDHDENADQNGDQNADQTAATYPPVRVSVMTRASTRERPHSPSVAAAEDRLEAHDLSVTVDANGNRTFMIARDGITRQIIPSRTLLQTIGAMRRDARFVPSTEMANPPAAEQDPPDQLLSSTRAENARALLAAQLPNPRSYNQQGPSREAMLADLNLWWFGQVDGPPQTDDQVHRRVISNMLGAAHRSREAWQLSRTLSAANISVAANSEEDEEEEDDNGEQESDEAPSPSRLRRYPVSELERIHHSANGAIMCRAVSRDPKPTHINFLHKLVCQFIDLRENRGGEDRPPNEFLCPLSLHAMCDPVVLSDGILYERAYARRSLDAEQISPMTREPLPHKLMFPCKALITLMESWVRLRVDVPEGGSLIVELQVTLDKHAPTESVTDVD